MVSNSDMEDEVVARCHKMVWDQNLLREHLPMEVVNGDDAEADHVSM